MDVYAHRQFCADRLEVPRITLNRQSYTEMKAATFYLCLCVVLDTGLLPFSEYEYTVVATNSVGKTASDPANVTTDEEPPETVRPPAWHLKPNEVDTIFLNWTDPIKPNGMLTLRLFNIVH